MKNLEKEVTHTFFDGKSKLYINHKERTSARIRID